MVLNNKIKVTIMIPTFNQVGYIKEAVESALAQTYENLEVVVSDDASTDDTQKILLRFNDPRLRLVLNSNNVGRVANYRNLLENHATGDYVVNLDGDDFYTDPFFIEEAVKLINNDSEVVMVAAKAKWTISNNEYVSSIPFMKETTGLVILRNLPNKNFFLKHLATLYKREDALNNGFYNSESNSSDWESLYRLSLSGKIRYLNRVVGVWRIHQSNESGTRNIKKLGQNLEIWESIYSDATKHGMSRFQARYLCAKNIAYFSSSFVTNISLDGNKNVVKFLLYVVSRYKVGAILLFITPKYFGRVVFSLCGYYRRKNLC